MTFSFQFQARPLDPARLLLRLSPAVQKARQKAETERRADPHEEADR
ncbi:MAG: hypothetical protein KDJ77_08910 [Rhodobiaceae bacterium]|nr:hypothetical protein [Rhodobiaceae bacterium]